MNASQATKRIYSSEDTFFAVEFPLYHSRGKIQNTLNYTPFL